MPIKFATVISLVFYVAIGWGTAHAQQQPSDELKSVRELARELFVAGQFEQAIVFGEQALALTVKEFGPEHEQVAIATYGLGLTADRAGNDAKAAEFYARSVEVREKVYGRESPGLAEALDRLGLALFRSGRVDEAEPVLRRALKLRKDIMGFDHAYQAGSIASLGAVAIARGRFPEAVSQYRKAIGLLAAQKTDFVYANKVLAQGLKRHRMAFIGLAQAVWRGRDQLGLSQRAAFDESFRAAQEAWRTSAAEAIAKMTARLGAAKTALGNDVNEMQKLADEIIAINEEDMRELARWSEVQRQSAQYVEARDAMMARSNERFKGGLDHVKRQRALSKELTELVKRCPPGQGRSGCTGSLDRIKMLGEELSRLSQVDRRDSQGTMELINRMNAIEKTLPGYDVFQQARQRRIARSTQLGITRRALRDKIIKSYPSYAALADPKPLAAADVQAFLGPDEALVNMLVGRSTSFVWVVTRETAAWSEVAVGERQLAAEVAALREALDPLAVQRDPNARTEFDVARSHRLYRSLLGPLEEHFKAKRHLIVVPNGPLTSLPPQVLVTRPPDPGASAADAAKSAAWLVRRHALSVLPSVQSLAALRRLQGPSTARKPFIGIGDPVLEGPDANAGTSRGAGAPVTASKRFYTRGLANVRAVSAMTPLPDTADELRAIARVLGASNDDILLRGDASEPRVRARDLGGYRVVHFATHGLVSGELDGVAEPALVLTPPREATELDDGLLTASEIATLRLDADWVVLSACNTAAGAEVGAEALSGLARAFFFSGARALLVSHWSVYSDAAVKLTTATFARLREKPALGRAEAFRQSMLKLIAEGRPPAYWAPFVIVGEGGGGR
jgi:CHAT domain-containing protein/tetratricopeptide (TPR) repeat protein